ncbi:hypothetical protein ACP3V9_24795, partial [Salmonella enterica]|uniref:hypothetical protein n=1 Tax=Salmonella enterica TaxID=28901 RepID=UPI003CED3868
MDELYVGMTTESVPADADGIVHSHSPYGRLAIWQHPLDPCLPGLRLATDPASVVEHWEPGDGSSPWRRSATGRCAG